MTEQWWMGPSEVIFRLGRGEWDFNLARIILYTLDGSGYLLDG